MTPRGEWNGPPGAWEHRFRRRNRPPRGAEMPARGAEQAASTVADVFLSCRRTLEALVRLTRVVDRPAQLIDELVVNLGRRPRTVARCAGAEAHVGFDVLAPRRDGPPHVRVQRLPSRRELSAST